MSVDVKSSTKYAQKFSLLGLLAGMAILVEASPVGALSYSNAINESSWNASSSVFVCRLEHQVPVFGSAVFTTYAGEKSKFHLSALSAKFDAGQAAVYSKSPIWKKGTTVEDLGMVPVKRGTRPMWLGTKKTEKMLSELNRGKEIEFVRRAWFEKKGGSSARLLLSNIGFREEYREYLNCLAGLLPANFDQMRRTALYFPAGQQDDKDGVGVINMRKLDKVLKLVKHDNKIRSFFIDGHTSSPGDRIDNLELSKQRAEMVAAYLMRRGVPEDWIKTRWHGERYPKASNGTSSGRAKNRRVTLRIERVVEIDVLPLAAK